MQISVLRRVVSISTISKQVTRAISVTSEIAKTKEPTTLKPWTEIPGPRSLPIIGPLHQFLPGGELYKLDNSQLIHKLYKSYGPIVRLGAFIGREPMIFLYDAESIEQGERWKEFRLTVNQIMLQPKTVKLYTEVTDEIAMEMIKRMKSQRDENNQIKGFFNYLNLCSLESMSVIALGCRMNCLDPNIKKDSPVFQLIDVTRNIFKSFDELDLKLSMWKIFATPAFKKAMKNYEQQEILSRYFIDEAVKDIERNPKKPDNQKGVLEKLLDINKDVAYIMASDLLLGGVDTVSYSVLGILYLLAKNTEKQNKLRETLRTNPENKAYLKACIKEGIRMMPVFNGNNRETTKEYNILGYRIPKGCQVTFAHQEMSLTEKYFVRADEYLPERWIAEKDDPLYYKNAHPFVYNPFGYGVRSCIGRRIAELKMETFVGRVIENFEIEWFGPPPKQSQTALNYIVGPLNFIFRDAKV